MPNCNVFTIKENSVSTHPMKHNIPNIHKNQIQSPFSRSQSFNNYIKYRNNLQNTKCNDTANEVHDFTTASDNSNAYNGAFNLHTVHNPTPSCIWGQPASNSHANTTFQTQNNVNTNTSTQFAPNSIRNQPWSVRRSDSFSPGKMSFFFSCECL